MSQEKKRAIVDAIIAKTKSGELAWEATYDDETFETNFRSSSVRITQMASGTTVAITILGIDGVILEQLNTHEVDYVYGQQMNELYAIVRRKALKIDETLDALLNELKS